MVTILKFDARNRFKTLQDFFCLFHNCNFALFCIFGKISFHWCIFSREGRDYVGLEKGVGLYKVLIGPFENPETGLPDFIFALEHRVRGGSISFQEQYSYFLLRHFSIYVLLLLEIACFGFVGFISYFLSPSPSADVLKIIRKMYFNSFQIRYG